MNWPNGLSVARLIMGPVVLVCLLTGYVRLAFYIFVVAMLTDLCDGYLARRSNRVTEFGKLMDPLADKVLVSLVLVGLLFMGLTFVSRLDGGRDHRAGTPHPGLPHGRVQERRGLRDEQGGQVEDGGPDDLDLGDASLPDGHLARRLRLG